MHGPSQPTPLDEAIEVRGRDPTRPRAVRGDEEPTVTHIAVVIGFIRVTMPNNPLRKNRPYAADTNFYLLSRNPRY